MGDLFLIAPSVFLMLIGESIEKIRFDAALRTQKDLPLAFIGF